MPLTSRLRNDALKRRLDKLSDCPDMIRHA